MKIIVFNDRSVLKSHNGNVQYENNATTLEFDFSKVNFDASNYTKIIHFYDRDGNSIGSDTITNDKYSLTTAVTKYKSVTVFLELISGDIDWRTSKFELHFSASYDGDEELTEEELGTLQQLINDHQTLLEEVSNLEITASKEDTTTTITITSKDGTVTTVEIEDGKQGEQGIQGVQGQAFTITKTYASIDEMEADVEAQEDGTFVMIASSVEDEDNAKLYYHVDGTWLFITDFSGATGIQGEQGIQGVQGIQGEKGDSYTITEDDYQAIADIVTDSAGSTFSKIVDNATEAYNENAETKLAEFNANASGYERKHSVYRYVFEEDYTAGTEITLPCEYVLDDNLTVFFCGERLIKDTHYTEISETSISLTYDVVYSDFYEKYLDLLVKEVIVSE